jgi:tetratricopeptide (TPR) repeat protein
MSEPSAAGDQAYRYDVFISYSHKDNEWVCDWLLPRLEAAGLQVCIDFRNFEVGLPSLVNMEHAVERSRKTLLVLTPNWIASEWTNFEALLVQTEDPSGLRRRTLPLMLARCESPKRIAMLTYADFCASAHRERELLRLIRALGAEAGQPEYAAQSPPPKAGPEVDREQVHIPRQEIATLAAAAGVTPFPLPPQSYFAHPYPLQENFTGRARERETLTGWLTGGRRPVLAVVALGGMGKSALTWAWLQRDVLGLPLPGLAPDPPEVAEPCRVPEDRRPEGIVWWSFYEREARFVAFLDHALAYASGGRVDPAAVPSAYEKTQALVHFLQRRRLLLVLDGFERELRAYAGLNAAYQGDALAGDDEQGDFSACVDPHAGNLLRWLAAGPLQGRVLLTGRLFPRELEGLAGCRRQDLDALDPEDALAFFQAQGVKGTRAEIQSACRPYGYHPLALRLLAGVILRDKRSPGDVRVAGRYPVLPELKGKERHHILQVAYDMLDRRMRDLLSAFSAFRSPMGYDALSTFNPYPGDEEFDAALDELMVRGLLFFDRERGCYDLHPIVRGYAYDCLADKAGVHTHLRDYFAALPAPEKDQVDSVEDLAPVVELYHHTVRAGQYDEAWELYRDRLADPLYFRLGAYQACIELLRTLFPGGENRPPRLKTERAQSWTANELANAYSLSGQPRRAVPLFEVSAELDEGQDDKKNLAIALGNLADMAQIYLGELAAAEVNLRRRIELCRKIEDEIEEAVGHQELGRLLTYRGAFDEAERELDASTNYWEQIGSKQGICLDEAYRALRALLMGEAEAALEAARRARELADARAYERDVIQAEWLLGAALVALSPWPPLPQGEGVGGEGEGLLAQAETHLTEALTRCRRVNLVELEPDILLAWARWHRAGGSPEAARRDAGEALAIAERCEYRLAQAEIHNFLARVAWERGNVLREAGDDAATRQALAEAKRHAETARERAWCDGPPHSYQVALEEAERTLEEIATAQG